MKKRILICDNGFQIYKPYIIKSLESNTSFKVKVIYNFENKKHYTLIERIFNKLRLPLDTSKFNKRIIEGVKSFNPEITFIIKGNNVLRSTLKKIKKINDEIKLISWTADNMVKKHNTSYHFDNSMSEYDIHFTTKSNIISDLYKRGAKKVVFLNKAYSKFDHFPEEYNKNFDFDILFIGSAEEERYRSMIHLAKNGFKVNVFGNMWGDRYKSSKNLIIHRKPLEGKEYREAISSSKITLCFLRQINDDLQTDRTMEIPACKGFMLAERTSEHSQLFEEDKEAVYFSSDDELLNKVKLYLNNNVLRDIIKEKGYLKAINSKYSFDDMISIIANYF